MQKFHIKRISGVVFDLSHLNDLVVDYKITTKSYKVRIIFSSHCFTEGYSNQSPSYIYAHNGERRAFSVERYQLSLQLPEYFKRLEGATVYHSDRRNYFFIRGNGFQYVVFFDAIRSKSEKWDVVINVQSAHSREHFVDRAAPVKFMTLLIETAAGRRPPIGPRYPIKRG